MKFSLTENDKTTVLDEVILAVISVLCLAAGIALIVFRPTVWIIEASMVVVAGFMLSLVGVMFIPCVIYRLMNNDKK